VTTKFTNMMTLDEAIEHYIEVSENCQNEQCSLEYEQLVRWLEELRQYREREERAIKMKIAASLAGLC
jgi:alcohol dehydrogenase class IV